MICQALVLTLCIGNVSMLDKLKKMLSAKERDNYVEKTANDVYRGIADKTELTKEQAAKIGGVESQHGKYTKNIGGGSATGMMQIMPRLAETLRPGSSKNLNDMNVQEELASDFINMNTPTIKELSKSPSSLNQYIMYNLGQGTGKRFLKAGDNEDISKILPAKVIKANPKLYKYKTVGEAKKAMQGFLDSRGAETEFYPNEQDFANLFKEEE